MFVILPPREVEDRDFGISLPGPFAAMGLLTDASLYPENVHVRAAFWANDNSGWEVIEVYSDDAHPKVVVYPKKKFSGVSLRRIDNANCSVIPDFGR